MKRATRRVALYVSGAAFAVLLVPSVVAFMWFDGRRAALYVALAAAYFGVMAVSAVLYAMMMDRSKEDTASSDFTLQYSVLQIMGFVAWGVGAVLADHVGREGTVALSLFMSLAALLLAQLVLRTSDTERLDPFSRTGSSDKTIRSTEEQRRERA
jgi:predicted MFS family arabinose efflux permease